MFVINVQMMLSRERMINSRSKHIDIRYRFTREAQDKFLVSVESDKNIADIFREELPTKEQTYLFYYICFFICFSESMR